MVESGFQWWNHDLNHIPQTWVATTNSTLAAWGTRTWQVVSCNSLCPKNKHLKIELSWYFIWDGKWLYFHYLLRCHFLNKYHSLSAAMKRLIKPWEELTSHINRPASPTRLKNKTHRKHQISICGCIPTISPFHPISRWWNPVKFAWCPVEITTDDLPYQPAILKLSSVAMENTR